MSLDWTENPTEKLPFPIEVTTSDSTTLHSDITEREPDAGLFQIPANYEKLDTDHVKARLRERAGPAKIAKLLRPDGRRTTLLDQRRLTTAIGGFLLARATPSTTRSDVIWKSIEP